MTKRLIAIVLASLLLSFVPQPAQAADLGRWHRDSVCVEKEISQYWGVNNAVYQWNNVDAGQPRLYFRSDCPYWGGIKVKTVWRPNWNHGGKAYISWRGRAGNIAHVTIVLNSAADRHLSTYYKRRWRRYVATHEFGHALGLSHNNYKGSVMSYSTNPYYNNGRVHWIDKRNLRIKY